jgi:thiamine-monophosphate kinase
LVYAFSLMAQGLGEFGRIERFFRPLAAQFAGALSLTDDAAIVDVPAGRQLVVTTDAIVEGVHFLADDPPGEVARKALRVNLSDLAAKGAHPLAYTLMLALPRDVPDAWVERFAAGLASDQARYGIALAGGDSVSTPGPITVSITAMGLVDAGRMVLRSGARPGDKVFVTGTIGDAALGLAVLTGKLTTSPEDRAILAGRYRLPEPRGRLAEALGRHAHAAIDVSDGLAADFGHLCRASGVSGELLAASVPLSPAARRVVDGEPGRLSDILSGGDDYELLMAVPAGSVGALVAAAREQGVPLSEIGHVESGPATITVVGVGGLPVVLERTGWTHG